MHFPDDNIRVISEFGQYYVAGACTLTSNILGKRKIKGEKTEKIMYFINDSVHRNFVNKVCDIAIAVPRPLFPVSKKK